ncbi:MAG TPA: hypothetical protein ENK59_00455 [Thioploca sp.]|nr:hypothetical protein [Thioploca sp.]
MPALRPVFTNNIIQTLQRGVSINLIAQNGQGRRRLLEDIKCTGLKNTHVIILNITNYKESYHEFIAAMWESFKIKKTVPKSLEELIEKVINLTEYKTILILHHFDELLNNSNIDCDTSFFDQLNSIKDCKKISLLCVTNQAHDQSVICIKNEVNRYSWLDLDKIRLPKLTYDEIMVELKYRNLPLSTEEISLISKVTYSHTKPYSLLNYLVEKIAIIQIDKETTFSAKLEILIKQYNLDMVKPSNNEYLSNVLHSSNRI